MACTTLPSLLSRCSGGGARALLVGASAPRLRPLYPYGELSTRLIISFARGSYFCKA